jgi:DNA-binding beta-propeller fold protein YncE
MGLKGNLGSLTAKENEGGGLMNKLAVSIIFVVVPAIVVAGNLQPVAAQTSDHAASFHLLEQHISLPGIKGRIDHLTADPKRKRLFVSAVGNNTIEVIDVFGGKTVHSITGFDAPKTAVFIPEFDKLVVISTGDAKVRIFDGASYALRQTIDLPGDFEMVRYDPTSKKLFVGWGDPKGNGGIAVIDPATGQKTNQDFSVGGSPESFEVEESGNHIFANVPDAGDVVVSVDRNTGEVKKWPIMGGKKNVAMALDEANHRLFTITRRPAVMAVFDTIEGKQVATLPVVGDCADVFYDKARKRIYVIGGWGYISVFQQKDPDHYEFIENVLTVPGARTGYFYPKRDLLYVAVQSKGAEPPQVWTYEPQY